MISQRSITYINPSTFESITVSNTLLFDILCSLAEVSSKTDDPSNRKTYNVCCIDSYEVDPVLKRFIPRFEDFINRVRHFSHEPGIPPYDSDGNWLFATLDVVKNQVKDSIQTLLNNYKMSGDLELCPALTKEIDAYLENHIVVPGSVIWTQHNFIYAVTKPLTCPASIYVEDFINNNALKPLETEHYKQTEQYQLSHQTWQEYCHQVQEVFRMLAER